MTTPSSRREFLRWSAGFSIMGAAAPFALQLTAASTAAAATAPGDDYKAIVCLFLLGGQDSNNLVLATDADSWGRYVSARSSGADPIALKPVGTPPQTGGFPQARPSFWGGVKPIALDHPNPVPPGTNASERTFALHPFMAPVIEPIWNTGRMAALANVGTLLQPTTKAQFEGRLGLPPQLFSHNDQASSWQAGAIDGAQSGWGGRIGDMLMALNGDQPIFTAVTAAGNAVFVSGNQINQYQVSTEGTPARVITARGATLFGSKTAKTTLDAIIQNTSASSSFAKDYAGVVVRGINASSVLNAKFNALPDILPTPQYIDPVQGYELQNPWLAQLHTIAQMIALGPQLGHRRQVFFAAVNAFDTHDNQNPREGSNIAQLAQAMVYFDQALATLPGGDMSANVTTFTASDFSRGFATNGSGTDHAWGGHHLIMGGAVKGREMYGQYPTLGIDNATFDNPDMSGAVMIPTTSVDQYGATLARWMGVSDSDVHTVFPRLAGFDQPYLGFL